MSENRVPNKNELELMDEIKGLEEMLDNREATIVEMNQKHQIEDLLKERESLIKELNIITDKNLSKKLEIEKLKERNKSMKEYIITSYGSLLHYLIQEGE